METIKLGDLVGFTLGKNRSRLDLPADEIYMPDDFTSDLHSRNNLSGIGDCVINQIQTKATVRSEKTQDKCLTSYFIQCKLYSEVLDSWYFCYQFNQGRELKRQIAMGLQGVTLSVKQVSIPTLEKMEIPIVSIDKQRILGRMYKQSIIQTDLMMAKAENFQEATLQMMKRIMEDE